MATIRVERRRPTVVVRRRQTRVTVRPGARGLTGPVGPGSDITGAEIEALRDETEGYKDDAATEADDAQFWATSADPYTASSKSVNVADSGNQATALTTAVADAYTDGRELRVDGTVRTAGAVTLVVVEDPDCSGTLASKLNINHGGVGYTIKPAAVAAGHCHRGVGRCDHADD